MRSYLGRRDKYQRDLKKYWIEKEVEGTYEKEVRKDNVRRLKVDMNDEAFDDNDQFGQIDGESDRGSEDDPGKPSDDDDDDNDSLPSLPDSDCSPQPRPRKRKGQHDAHDHDKKDKNKRRRSKSEVSVEEPLEAHRFSLNASNENILVWRRVTTRH